MASIGETLANRRTADREYKREALARNKDGNVARKTSSNVDSVAQPRKAEDGIILQVAKYLADRQQIECEFGEWEAEIESSTHTMTIVLRRADQDFVKRFTIAPPEFDLLVRR